MGTRGRRARIYTITTPSGPTPCMNPSENLCLGYMLGGVSAYVLGGFFTEGVSITKTMFFYIFSLQWSNSILSVTDCFRFFPIISDSSFAPKNKKTKNVRIFKVSLELRFIFEFWVSYPDNLWFLPNFFGKLFHFMWTIFDFQFLPHSFFLPNSQKKFEKPYCVLVFCWKWSKMPNSKITHSKIKKTNFQIQKKIKFQNPKSINRRSWLACGWQGDVAGRRGKRKQKQTQKPPQAREPAAGTPGPGLRFLRMWVGWLILFTFIFV